ncbi:MAG TPA: PEP-CTERM sorting domain-containing protein, partial [Candidatus Omnitrophica bacterium]|nr:PEP-CTERM sorting domain-containing protein [Candidatus Omnitrophota bacterium]
YRPYLEIESTPIPEPSTLILLGSLATGLFGMAGLRRKSSRR